MSGACAGCHASVGVGGVGACAGEVAGEIAGVGECGAHASTPMIMGRSLRSPTVAKVKSE